MSRAIQCVRFALREPNILHRAYKVRCFSTSDKMIDITYNNDTEISTITLQRAPVNGLNLELLQELNKTLSDLEKNKSAGVILTSAMPTIFSGGLDIMEMYKPKPDRLKQFWTTLQDTWLNLYSSSFPTVAVINGHSPAGGCLLALSCEYRVMVGPKFTIGLNETQLGIVAPRWFRDSFKNVIGFRQAELALTSGRMFKTEEALKIGLIDETATDKADAIKKAEAFLEVMSAVPRDARSITKRAVREETVNWLVENRQKDLDFFLTSVNLPKVQQGLEMYMAMMKAKK